MGLPESFASPAVRAKIATLLFLLTLLFGNVSLIGGMELGAGMSAAAVFAVVCIVWWISFRISRSANARGLTLGLVALSLWILNLIAALLFDFHHYIRDRFFWASAVTLLVLIAALARTDKNTRGSEGVAKVD